MLEVSDFLPDTVGTFSEDVPGVRPVRRIAPDGTSGNRVPTTGPRSHTAIRWLMIGAATRAEPCHTRPAVGTATT